MTSPTLSPSVRWKVAVPDTISGTLTNILHMMSEEAISCTDTRDEAEVSEGQEDVTVVVDRSELLLKFKPELDVI